MNKSWDRPIVRYFFMAAFVVGAELSTFVLLNSVLGMGYLWATPLSLIVAVVLNWYLGRVFVFGKSKYRTSVEFGLVAVASIVGLLIQLSVTTLSVEVLNLLPLIGKLLAIITTFFWNFWIRKRYIFND